MNLVTSSNPALNHVEAVNPFAYRDAGASPVARPTTTTIQGVVNKTAVLVAIAVASGAGGYVLLGKFPSAIWIASIASFLLVLGFGFFLCRKPQLAMVIGPIYAVIEGVFLGGFTALADNILAAQGLEAALGGVGLQAFIITIACVVSMLGLYAARIIQPTARFKAVLFTLTGAIMIAYLVSFVMSLFGASLPLISFASAVSATGTMGFLGLGINVFILIVASLMLIVDFGEVEAAARAGAPKYMEWYFGFALLITLAWIYFEAVKLTVRLAVLFGGRE